ncbi:MAG: hypothetical protein ACE5I5_12950 [Candidatus Heimdallarchaeota archaeon]
MDIKEIIETIKSQPALFYIILVILTIYLVAYFSYLTSPPEAIKERRRELKEILNLAPLFAFLALVFLAIGREDWVRNDVFLGSLFVIYVLGVWIFSKHLANHYNSVGRTRFSIPFLSIGLVLVGLPILQSLLETLPRIPDILRLFSIGVILCGIFGALNLFLLDQLLKNILMMIPWKTRGVLITTSGIISFIVSIFHNPDLWAGAPQALDLQTVSLFIFLLGLIDLTKRPLYEGILRIYIRLKIHWKMIVRGIGTGSGLYFIVVAFFQDFLLFMIDQVTELFRIVWFFVGISLLIVSNQSFFIRIGLQIWAGIKLGAFYLKRGLLSFYTWFKVNVTTIISLFGVLLIWYDLFGKSDLWKNGLLSLFGGLFLSGSNYGHVIQFASWAKKELVAGYHWLSRNLKTIVRVTVTGTGIYFLLLALLLTFFPNFLVDRVSNFLIDIIAGLVVVPNLLSLAIFSLGIIMIVFSNFSFFSHIGLKMWAGIKLGAFYLKRRLLSFYTWLKMNFSTILRVLGSLGGVILIILGWILDVTLDYRLLFIGSGVILLSGSNPEHVLRFASWTKIQLLAFYHWFSRNFILILRSSGTFTGLALIIVSWFLYDGKLVSKLLGVGAGGILLAVSNHAHVLRFASWAKTQLLAFYHWVSRNFGLILRSLGTFSGLAIITYDLFLYKEGLISAWFYFGVILQSSSNYDYVLRFASWAKTQLLAFYHWVSRNWVLILRSLGSFTGLAFITIDLFLVKKGEVLDNWLFVAGGILLLISNHVHVLRFASWAKTQLLAFYHWFSRNFVLIIRVLGSGLGVVLLLMSIFPSTINALDIPPTFMNGRVKSQYLFIFAGFILLVASNHRFIWLLLTRAARWFIRNRVMIIRVCGSFVGLTFIIFERLSPYFGGYDELRVTLGFSFIILSNKNFTWSLILRISYGLRLFARFMAALVARAYSWLGRNKWSILRGVGTFIGLFLIFFGSVEPLSNIELMARFVSPITDFNIPPLIYRFSGAVLLIASNFKVSKRIFLEIWELLHRLGLIVWKDIKSFALWVTKNIRAIMKVLITGLGVFLQGIGVVYLLYGRRIIVESPFGPLALIFFGAFLCIVANPQEFRILVRAIKNSILSIWRWIRTEKVLVVRTLLILVGFYLVSRWVYPGIPLLQSLVDSENEVVTILDYCLPFASFIMAFIDYVINYLIIAFNTIKESLKLFLAWVKKHFTEIRKVTVTFLVGLFWLYFLVFQTLPRNWQVVVILLGLTVLIINFARDIVRVIKSFVQALQDALKWVITGFKKLIVFFKEWTVVMGMVLLALVFMIFGGYVIIFQALLVSELKEALVPMSLGLGSIALGVILFWLVNKRRRISPEKGVKG